MSKDHRRLVGLQAVSLQRAVDLNNQIADRAAQLEKDLMRDAEGLRKAMAGEESQYRLRRLEAAYLKVMHRLAMVRRAHALAREHGPVDAPQGAGGNVSGQAVADAIRKAASAVLGIPASLLKGRVKGHWRTTDSGKMVWVAEYTNRRTKKQTPQAAGQLSMFDDEPDLQGHVTAHMDQRDKLAAKEQEKKNANEDTPPPTAPTEEEAALGRETADNDGTLDAQARAAQDEEKARDEAADGTVARDQEPEPVDADGPQYAIDYHLRDTKGNTYTLESVGEDRASIVLRDENGTEIDRLSPRPTKAAEEDLLKIGSHKYLRKEPGTPADAKAGIFSPGHENWEPPTPEETEAEKAQRIAEEAEAEKARQERLEAEITQRPEPEWGSFDAGEHRWDNGNTVYFVSRSRSSGVYTIGSYARQTGEYDRAFYTKSWRTKSGAQRYLDRFIADYGSRYSTRDWQKIDSRTGRPATERKAEPAGDGTTAGTSGAGSTDTAGGAVIRDNPDWGSVEVKFPAKPSDEIRARLKSAGFRWSGKHGVWYSKKPGARDAASAILGMKKSARRRHPLLGILGGRQ